MNDECGSIYYIGIICIYTIHDCLTLLLEMFLLFTSSAACMNFCLVGHMTMTMPNINLIPNTKSYLTFDGMMVTRYDLPSLNPRSTHVRTWRPSRPASARLRSWCHKLWSRQSYQQEWDLIMKVILNFSSFCILVDSYTVT